MRNEDDMEEMNEETVVVVRHMADAIQGFSEFMAVKNHASPGLLVASIALALVNFSFEHANPGQHQGAIERAIKGIRIMHDDLMGQRQDEAIAEAEEAKAKGRVQ
jgi:hypothetical protein